MQGLLEGKQKFYVPLGEPSKVKNWRNVEKFHIWGSWPIHKKNWFFYGFEGGEGVSHPFHIFLTEKDKNK